MSRLALILLCLIPSVALALDVILQIDGKTIRSIDADRVNVITNDQRQLIDVRTTPKSPDPKPPIEPPELPPTACGPRPPRTVVVDTGTMLQRFNKQQYRPQPNDIIAFRFRTPPTGNHRGRATATVVTESPRAKLLSISACPGDHDNPVALSNACVQAGVEVAQVTFTTARDADARFECVLERGKAYYINAVSIIRFGSTTHSCTTSRDCGFSFMRDPS